MAHCKPMKPYEEFKDPTIDNKDNTKGYNHIFKTEKEFLDHYYVVPKSNNLPNELIELLEKHRVYYTSEEALVGYYCFTPKKKQKRFTEEDCNKIQDEYDSGLSYKRLSIKYKCSTSTLYKILKGKYFSI